MWSKQTSDLYSLFQASRKQDFKKWIVDAVNECYQIYLVPQIRYIQFDTEAEYDDQGGYYDTLSSITLYDENQKPIDLDDPEYFKPEYLDGNEDFNEDVPDFDEFRWDVFGEIANDLKEMNLTWVLIDLKDGMADE